MSTPPDVGDEGRVILDTSVLFPPTLRDTLLRAAEAGLYIVQWSDDILSELRRNLIANADVRPAAADSLIGTLRAYFPEATISGYEPRIAAMTNHPKDRHVLAAAVHGGARRIVTANIRDFPAAALDTFSVEAQTPDTFLVSLWHLDDETMARTVREQAAAYRKPPRTTEEIVARLAKHAPRFTRLVRTDLH